MKSQKGDFPLDIKISFNKVFEYYRSELHSKNDLLRERSERILKIAEQHPVLSKGISERAELDKYSEEIDLILESIFSSALQKNEIKIASVPYRDFIFKSSQRYKDIIAAAGQEYTVEMTDFDQDLAYILGCSIILNVHYGFKIDFKRPFYYKIPNAEGVIRYYRSLYNADFIEIEKKKNSIEITQEDVDELLENFNNIAVWKEKFPPKSWIFKGFVIANMYDATMDVSLSDFKTQLLKHDVAAEDMNDEFQRIFRSIFNVKDLKIGFSDFNEEDETFEKVIYKNIHSYILSGESSQICDEALCDTSYYTLFKKNEVYCVTNTEKYHKRYPKNVLYKKLLDQGIKSAILASIVHEGKVLGVLELVSSHINELNTINAHKLTDIMPFLIDSVVRTKEQAENELELVIQEECTSIHHSVHWKFKKEAKRYLNALANNFPTFFREIVFEDVYPLYGQIDIKGSSEARNVATKKDLKLQLEYIQDIIQKIFKLEELPVYEHFHFRISNYIYELEQGLQVDSERKVLNFLHSEIIPLFTHLKGKSETLKEFVEEYYELIDKSTGLLYKYRKDYDESVMLINKRMASVLDRKQNEAQQMYPHYFERFKTDGVEHNMYIGESITKTKSFNKIYLYNLRLWQLQAMWEMENSYYKLKEQLPIPLDVASMILSFNSPLSLRFRMDEKRFDVDGTYNARYEVVKKRVDKAFIKGTEDRITQAGKITIIYSQKEDEREYLKYIAFLQYKKMLDTDEEIVELEELQGVTGLKAIRVSVLYSKEKDNSKEYYTYDDLMTQINS